MKLYENVVIGNFLYGLGFSIGNAIGNKRQLSVVNLLQQTPADKLLADVLLEFPGVVRIIEFKNGRGNLKKEQEKCKQLSIALRDKEEMQKISREIHWYVETEPFQMQCINNIKPYLDAFGDGESCFTLDSFIEEITHNVINPNFLINHEKLKAYLAIVKMCQGSRDVGTGGIIVAVGNEELRYVQFTDIMQLRLQHRQFVNEIKLEFENFMEKSIKKEKKRNITRELGR